LLNTTCEFRAVASNDKDCIDGGTLTGTLIRIMLLITLILLKFLLYTRFH